MTKTLALLLSLSLITSVAPSFAMEESSQDKINQDEIETIIEQFELDVTIEEINDAQDTEDLEVVDPSEIQESDEASLQPADNSKKRKKEKLEDIEPSNNL